MPMPGLGSLLKKKRTKDRDTDPQSPTSPTHHDKASLDHTLTNSSAQSQQPSQAAIDDTGAFTEKGQDALLQASPSQQNLVSGLTQEQQENAQEMKEHNMQIDSAPDHGEQPVGHIQPPMAQTRPPPNAQQSGIRPMADGSWPVQRDAKATKGKYGLKDFAFQRTLGTGSFGRVHLVQSKHNQRFYAIKVLKKAQVVKMKQVEHTNDERRMLAKVKHPFLITLWGTFSDSKNLYMVMDFVEGGELFSLLRKSQVCHDPRAPFASCRLTDRPSAISEPRRQILRRRSHPGARLSAFLEHHLPRSQARKLAAGPSRASQDHGLWVRQGSARYHLDSMRYPGLSGARSMRNLRVSGGEDSLTALFQVVASKGYNKSVDWYV